jgi:hypothetical protein
MKTDRLGLIRTNYSLKPVSFMEIGKEVLSDSSDVQSIVQAHSNLNRSLKIVGFGLLGLFTVHKFIK